MNQFLEAVEHLTRPLEPDRTDLDNPVYPCHQTGRFQVEGHVLAIQARRRDQLVPLSLYAGRVSATQALLAQG